MITALPLNYPEKYNSGYVLSCEPPFTEELSDIIERSGEKIKFKNKFRQRLNYLTDNKDKCILHEKWFEELKHIKTKYRLYSLRVKDKLNTRVLFIITKHNAIFLLAFQERSDSSSVYSKYTPTVLKRIANLVKDGLIKEEDILCQI